MNLIKLFNKNYAIQNMKKSKGILAIMFIIIPIVTLFALYNYDNESYNQPYNIYVLANINIVGMFIIPFILSNVLLGYVYKKNSIDFINSMPISRKKIYLTNILIGIVYLILLQLANFIISAIYIGIIGNSLTSFQMILDLLLIMIVGYSFIYVISCLSLTISGNKFTQMVVLMVIIFFIPFIRFVNFSIISENDVNLIVANGYSEIYNATFNVPLFTIPIECFKALFINETIYNLKSTFITIILSLVYIIIGTKLFEKRKMEDTGYSFKSTKIHLIVKALTLYPMINVIERIYKSMSIPELILITFLMFVYYFVYDLITNKKIKFKVTIIGFIATCVILWIVIWGMETFCKFAHKDIKIEMNDIKQVGVNLFDEFDIDETEKLVVTNQETLNLIFDNMFPITRKSDYKSYYNDDTIKSLILSLKLKNNKKVNITVYLEEDKYKEVISRLKEDEAYINSIINYYTIENDGYFEIYNSYINLNSNKKLKEAVNKNIKEYVKNTMQLVIDDKAKYYTERFEIYEYKNHKLYRSVMQIYESTQMEKDILRILNEISKNKILKIAENSEDNEIIYTISRKINQYEEESRKEIREYQNDKIFNFIKEDYANEFDSSKPYYKIQARRVNHYKENVFYTNNVEKFEKCIENQMNLEEDFYFLDTSLYDGKYYEYNETSEVMENDL